MSPKAERRIWIAFWLGVVLSLGAILAWGQPAPALTEIERLKLENIQLKASSIQIQIKDLEDQFAELQKQYKELTDRAMKEHPGYIWNGSALVPQPPLAKPAKRAP